jgi:uncharacterized protein (DUF1778 family)
MDEIHRETIYLSERDMERFLEVLNNPPEPNEKLKEAARNLIELENKR